MLGWAVTFLVALIAAVLRFGGVAGAAVTAAKLVFVVALIGICAVGVLRDGEASPLKPAR